MAFTKPYALKRSFCNKTNHSVHSSENTNCENFLMRSSYKGHIKQETDTDIWLLLSTGYNKIINNLSSFILRKCQLNNNNVL